LSAQPPLNEVPPVFGPAYVVVAVHQAIPENALPWKEIVTGWLYQPFASGGRDGTALAAGDEIST
jgi:hypothetical protein